MSFTMKKKMNEYFSYPQRQIFNQIIIKLSKMLSLKTNTEPDKYQNIKNSSVVMTIEVLIGLI